MQETERVNVFITIAGKLLIELYLPPRLVKEQATQYPLLVYTLVVFFASVNLSSHWSYIQDAGSYATFEGVRFLLLHAKLIVFCGVDMLDQVRSRSRISLT